MEFSQDEINLIYQYAAKDKEQTIGGLREIFPFIRHSQTKLLVEQTIGKLQQIPDMECNRLIQEIKKKCMEERDLLIEQRYQKAKKDKTRISNKIR